MKSMKGIISFVLVFALAVSCLACEDVTITGKDGKADSPNGESFDSDQAYKIKTPTGGSVSVTGGNGYTGGNGGDVSILVEENSAAMNVTANGGNGGGGDPVAKDGGRAAISLAEGANVIGNASATGGAGGAGSSGGFGSTALINVDGGQVGGDVTATGGAGGNGSSKNGGKGASVLARIEDGSEVLGNISLTGGNGGASNGQTDESDPPHGGDGGTATGEYGGLQLKDSTVSGSITVTGGNGGNSKNSFGGSGGSAGASVSDSTVSGSITVTGGDSGTGKDNSTDTKGDPVEGGTASVTLEGTEVSSNVNAAGGSSSTGGNGGDGHIIIKNGTTVDGNISVEGGSSDTEGTGGRAIFNIGTGSAVTGGIIADGGDGKEGGEARGCEALTGGTVAVNGISAMGGNGSNGNGGNATGFDGCSDMTAIISDDVSAMGGKGMTGGDAYGLRLICDNSSVVAEGDISAVGGKGVSNNPDVPAEDGKGYGLYIGGEGNTVVLLGETSGYTADILFHNQLDPDLADDTFNPDSLRIVVSDFDFGDEQDPAVEFDDPTTDQEVKESVIEKVFHYIIDWLVDGKAENKDKVSMTGAEHVVIDGDHEYDAAQEKKVISFKGAGSNRIQEVLVGDERYTPVYDSETGTYSVTVLRGGGLSGIRITLMPAQQESNIIAVVQPVRSVVEIEFSEAFFTAEKNMPLVINATVTKGLSTVLRNPGRIRVLVDDMEVSAENFILNLSEDGKLSVELVWEFLRMLSAGSHTLKISYGADSFISTIMV